jgi:O-antigen ligase
MHMLFGFGYMQSTDFRFLPTVIFDNTELDIYLYAGILGVALFTAVLLVLFSFAVRQWRETGRIAWLTVASLFIGMPLFSTINIDLDQAFFEFVFGLLVGGAVVPEMRPVAALSDLPDLERLGGLSAV